MLRLVLRDFYLSLKAIPFLIGISCFFIYNGVTAPKPSAIPMLVLIPIAFVFSIVGTAVITDDKYRTELLYCSLPIKRSSIVRSRYLTTFFAIVLGITCTFPANLFLPVPIINFKAALFAFFIISGLVAISLPINFRFGSRMEAEPVKLALTLIFTGIGLGIIIYSIISSGINLFEVNNILVYLGSIITVEVLVSIKLSEFFYNRREF